VKKELSATTARDTAEAILRYLENHPEAKDTLEGIAQWWLLREWSERLLGDVERAVSLLLSQGFLLESRREGLPAYYGLNPQERDAISKFLKRS